MLGHMYFIAVFVVHKTSAVNRIVYFAYLCVKRLDSISISNFTAQWWHTSTNCARHSDDDDNVT